MCFVYIQVQIKLLYKSIKMKISAESQHQKAVHLNVVNENYSGFDYQEDRNMERDVSTAA